MKARVKYSDGVTEVKVLAKHPMESGQRKDADGKLIPAHHIQDLTAKYEGETIFVANLGPAVSKNPYVAFRFKGGEVGKNVEFMWVDNKGATKTITAPIK